LNNGGNARKVTANGAFTFTTAIASGAAYAVTVGTQPSGKTCTVANGSGSATANFADVSVACNEPTSYLVSTLAGSGAQGSEDGAGANSTFATPFGVSIDAAGNVYVADSYIRKITAAGVVSKPAGSGALGSAEAGAIWTLSYTGLAVDAAGNVYVANANKSKIHKITAAGVVSTLAGSGSQGSADGAGANATFSYPRGLAVDAAGNVYVADYNNHKIRKITAAGVVSTLAGSGSQGSADGAGAIATFSFPAGVAVDAAGNVYVADSENQKIRKITAAGVVSTLAGSGSQGSADGAGANASFNSPFGVSIDAAGNVYVADSNNYKIRKITAAGVVSTLAGSGSPGNADGAGANATFSWPTGISVDANGVVYVVDTFNNKIRKLTPQ
jgi:sugar lactone lactonase YvrE